MHFMAIFKEFISAFDCFLIACRCAVIHSSGVPIQDSDTVYFTVGDCEGNVCSFINSNFCGFGTGLVPLECGFTLQVYTCT